ncbi:ORC2-domain-containing protein [Choiromyces venosus 120613-1]|uniref:Origin recognition complex subunit 2 n=1 Tax=Choiromyces venosus 120613-1 TaxID=1336337 RepID=A0A3N4K8D4_9PEZI|nr:ORC2-domain-containing protein [Choiromyces venosus 120613-1]
MKRKRTVSASPRNTPTKPSSSATITTTAPTLASIPLNLPAATAAEIGSSNTPNRPLPLPETPGKQRRTTLLHPEQLNGTGVGTGTESVHTPSPLKRQRTPMIRDGNSTTTVRFADSVVSPGDAMGGLVTNADRSARRKSVRRIVSKAIGGGEDSDDEDEDEEDLLARKIFGGDDSDDIDGGLLADEETLGAQKKRSGEKSSTSSRKKKKQLVEEEITAPMDGPDSYFFQNRKARLVTSNSTLASLPALDHSSYFRLIREHVPDHVDERAYLEGLHRQNFPQWEFELKQGFNLLLYGYGSKRNLLMQFAKRIYRSPRSLVVINGYVPTLTIKDVLTTVAKAIIGPEHTIRLGSNPNDILDTILSILDTPRPTHDEVDEKEEYTPVNHITLLLHNIDGEALRTTRAQVLLSRLSSHPKISLVASIDHIRAPLLWDAARVSQFNFLWHDATTFAPYSVESSIDDSLALIGGSAHAGGTKGVKFVLASLPMNAKSLYRVLVSHQLQGIEDGGGDGEEVGVEYKVLYQKAVEEFICSNDMAFRTLLKEFQDHQMVSLKKDSQGTDVLWAPFKKEELETILEDLVA